MKIVYVVGANRSGSTLLDVILSKHPALAGFGELVNLPQDGWIGNELCSCGRRADACTFWADVRARWQRTTGSDADRFLRLRCSFERSRFLYRAACAARRRSERFRQYADQTRALVEVLAEVSGAESVVDSSKLPARAFALGHVAGIDLSLIHLVRDCRGVAWSQAKAFARRPEEGLQRDIAARAVWRTAFGWVLINMYAEWVCRRVSPGRFVRLRYEDLVGDSRAFLGAVATLTGYDFGAVIESLERDDALPVGHKIAGNRLRMAGTVRMRPDQEWRERLTQRDLAVCRLLAGGMLRRYGYGPSGSEPGSGSRGL